MIVTSPTDGIVRHVVRPRLDGVKAIGDYIGKSERWVYQARERGWSVPIRKRDGLGYYAFPDELDAWLNDPETLPHRPA